MKENINEDLQQLLDSLEEHGRNTRRQQALGDLIDSLEMSSTSSRGSTTKQSRQEVALQSGTSTSDATTFLNCFVPRNDAKRHKLYPLWWAMGAAAACLLLWLILKPAENLSENFEQNDLAETEVPISNDSTKYELQETTPIQELLLGDPIAETEPVRPERHINTPKKTRQPEVSENVMVAEILQPEPIEPEEEEPEPITMETASEPVAQQTPVVTRRVIQSTTLVGYGKPDQANIPQPRRPIMESNTLFGQPLDPNMKNGMLAYEIKLH